MPSTFASKSKGCNKSRYLAVADEPLCEVAEVTTIHGARELPSGPKFEGSCRTRSFCESA